METLAPPAAWHSARMSVTTTRATEFVDITDRLASLVTQAGVRTGLINVQSLHTTTAIVVNEHEPLLLADFEWTLARAAPAEGTYRHDDVSVRTVNLTADERVNGHAHCRALLLSSSACLNIVDGRLLLGTWQRVFFAELDGPRERRVSVVVFGDPGDAIRQHRAHRGHGEIVYKMFSALSVLYALGARR